MPAQFERLPNAAAINRAEIRNIGDAIGDLTNNQLLGLLRGGDDRVTLGNRHRSWRIDVHATTNPRIRAQHPYMAEVQRNFGPRNQMTVAIVFYNQGTLTTPNLQAAVEGSMSTGYSYIL